MSSGSGEEMGKDQTTAEAATGAASASPEAGPQPPYDEDFNPFSEKDKEKILHEEGCKEEAEGWKFVNSSQYTEVWRKADTSKPVHLVKGYLQFPGIPPNVVADLIHNSERRKEWDTFFDVIEVVEEHKNFRVMYWLSKLPLTISDRDVVQFIRREYDESTNTTYFLYRNATHPNYPERRGIVRAETILSGVIVRPDPEDPGSTKLSLMLQTDMKGWIPHMIVNTIAARSPKQWRDSLANFYTNVYSKELEKQRSSGDGAQGKEEDGQGQAEAGAEKQE
ncbi:START domain-containing protein 10 [Geodia barretti]|uniref:START domain-containing protein 10 n=1 Tax=Geodia barretti TaxID=519541 RepID=A0AA35WQG6_GEOBA|nr:START domain-containing protein 10 [Geodia barretti]